MEKQKCLELKQLPKILRKRKYFVKKRDCACQGHHRLVTKRRGFDARWNLLETTCVLSNTRYEVFHEENILFYVVNS